MSPGPEDEVSQAEKARIIREQASSILDHARAAANDLGGGRFAAIGSPTVVGAQPLPKYPAAGAHQSDPVGTEPPLGIDINAMPELEDPTGTFPVVQPVDRGGAAAAPSSSLLPDDAERAAPPSSNKRSE
jgi:hypothetical protein